MTMQKKMEPTVLCWVCGIVVAVFFATSCIHLSRLLLARRHAALQAHPEFTESTVTVSYLEIYNEASGLRVRCFRFGLGLYTGFRVQLLVRFRVQGLGALGQFGVAGLGPGVQGLWYRFFLLGHELCVCWFLPFVEG